MTGPGKNWNPKEFWNKIYSIRDFNAIQFNGTSIKMNQWDIKKYVDFEEGLLKNSFGSDWQTQKLLDNTCYYRDGLSLACLNPRRTSNPAKYKKDLEDAQRATGFYTENSSAVLFKARKSMKKSIDMIRKRGDEYYQADRKFKKDFTALYNLLDRIKLKDYIIKYHARQRSNKKIS